MNTLDKFLCKALEAYPYDLEGTIESLDYALSYDAENSASLCLYGKVYAEQFRNLKAAKGCFREAMSADMSFVEVYPCYIQVLIDFEEDEDAEKLIAYALTVKGVCKAEIMAKLILLKEKQRDFKEATKHLKELKLIVLNNDYNNFISSTEKRIKEKKGMLKK
jgi:tetratricopeptide (TPR) repeat protein